VGCAAPTFTWPRAISRRKAAKRLRYATEPAVPVVGRPAERLRRRLEAVHAAEETGAARAERRLPAAWRRLRRPCAVGRLRPRPDGRWA
jgi:hypothetical protein